MNKSDYYHNFEAWLRSWPKAVQVTGWEGQPGWPIFFLNNQSNLIQTIFLYNNNGFLTCVSSQVDLGFLSGLVKLNLPLFFLKLELVQAPGQSGSGSTRQVSHSFITRVIIILLILTLNIN
jgi:hypothetical protein